MGKWKYHDLDQVPLGCSHIPEVCVQPHGGYPCWILGFGHLEGHREQAEGFFCSLHPMEGKKIRYTDHQRTSNSIWKWHSHKYIKIQSV